MSAPQHLDVSLALASSDRIWEEEIIPALFEYIRIPNKSQAFDPRWHEHGHMERAVALIERAGGEGEGAYKPAGAGDEPVFAFACA